MFQLQVHHDNTMTAAAVGAAAVMHPTAPAAVPHTAQKPKRREGKRPLPAQGHL